jgi:Uma2 family endonuclease
MTVVILGPRPPEVDALIERRRALGHDLYDEVWEGTYVMSPAPTSGHAWLQIQIGQLLSDVRGPDLFAVGAFNLGVGDDFRVPDAGVFRHRPGATWLSTAAVVIEIVSPGDRSMEKFDFYAEHDVDEVCVIDPDARTVRWFALRGDRYDEVDASAVIDSSALDALEWPD